MELGLLIGRNCTFADDIKDTATEPVEYEWLINFTFLDGTKTSDDVWSPGGYMWSDAPNRTNLGIPHGGTTYFAMSLANATTSELPSNMYGVEFSNGFWIPRIKFTPYMH
jgi:hypothetical protein